MSSQSAQDTSQAISDTITVSYVEISAFVVLAYDTVLTLPHEIEYLWNKKIKLGTALYFLARYPALCVLSLNILSQFLNQSLQTCTALFHFEDTIGIMPLIGVQGLLLARTYAIADHKYLVLVVLGVLGCCSMFPTIAVAILDRCDIAYSQGSIIRRLNDINTIGVVLFDTIVVSVILVNTLGTWRVYKRSVWHKLSLTHLLAQQSLLRLGFVLTVTVAEAILPVILRPAIGSIVGPMQNSLSTIIICRFHLELQQRNAHPNTNTSLGLPTISLKSFHAATRRMHDNVMAEFGNSSSDERVENETSREELVLPESHMPSGMIE